MTGNNPPNSLVTIAKGDYDNVALDMLLNTTAAVEKATGKSAPVINGEAFSAHTGTQLAALNDYLKTHPNANVTYSCIDPTSGLNDAVYTEGWLEEHADLLKKYDVPINVVFGPYDTTKVAYEVLEKYDLNVQLIVPENRSPGNADGHWKTNEAFLGGLSWYLAGISDEDFSELYKVYKGKYSDKEIYDIFTRKGIIVPGGYKIPPIEPVKLSGLNSFLLFQE